MDALAVGLSDSTASVRASSAIALSWIGPRAKAAIPALMELVDDPDPDVLESTLTAIGRMGPLAKDSIPRVKPLLATAVQVKAAATLRLVNADPELFIPTLVANLAGEHMAAIELGQLGDPAVPALLHAMKDKNAARRQNAAYTIANMAGWGKLTQNHGAVVEALIELTHDEDREVVWHATQAIGSIHASADKCIPVLIKMLQHSDPMLVTKAAESLGNFGDDAKSAHYRHWSDCLAMKNTSPMPLTRFVKSVPMRLPFEQLPDSS